MALNLDVSDLPPQNVRFVTSVCVRNVVTKYDKTKRTNHLYSILKCDYANQYKTDLRCPLCQVCSANFRFLVCPSLRRFDLGQLGQTKRTSPIRARCGSWISG